MALTLLQSFCLAIFLALGVWASQVEARDLAEMSMVHRHEQWMAEYGREYMDTNEKEKRLLIFKNNVERIESFNKAGDKPYKLGINQFADLDEQEFKASRTGYNNSISRQRPSLTSNTTFRYNLTDYLPTRVDWREAGAVSPIKNQGRCGCCWAFATVAAMEGITRLKTGTLQVLSEQELVDCDNTNFGCHGGSMDDAYQFIQNKGLTLESDYPYKGKASGTCEKATSHAATINGYGGVGGEESLLIAVAHQPVSIALEGSGNAFQFYKSGIFTGKCGTNMDHAVTVIGYGVNEEDGMKYWLVKNSWGTSWGEDGFMRIQRDVGAHGLCGLAMDATYPIA